MKIKLDNLWRYSPGITVVVNGVRYYYIGRDTDSHMLYDTCILTSVEELLDDPDMDVEINVVDYNVNTTALVNAQLHRVLSLVEDGWQIGHKMLDLQPELKKLELYKMIQNLANTEKATYTELHTKIK